MSRPIDPRLLVAVPSLRRLLTALGLVYLAAAAFTVAQAGLLAEVVVAIFVRHDRPHELFATLVLLAGVAGCRALLAALQEWVSARASTRVRAELRAGVLLAVRSLGPSWAQRQPAGRLATAAGPGLEALDGYVSRALPALVGAAVIPAIIFGRIAFADWQSALLLLVALPLVPVFMALVGIASRRSMQRQYEALARLSGHFLDLVAGLTTLRIYGQADRQIATVRRATDAYRRRTMTTLRTAFLSGLVLDLIATLSVAVVAVDIGLRLDHSQLSLGTALVVLLLAPELFAPLRAMGAQHHASEEGRACAAAALDVIDEAAAIPVAAGHRTVGRATGTLAFSAVHVTYPGRAEHALNGLDLEVKPGQIVALRGRSGSGKSTLLSCLLRFVAAGSGRIRVGTSHGDHPLAELRADHWREQVAWVPQRPQPTQETVGDEVLLGDPHATRTQLLDAVASCHAPHPDTLLGEAGSAVSAGQLRRVALARAVLRARRQIAAGATPIVLLDEPSEDLDEYTEGVVAGVVGGLAGKATVLMVTHSDALAAVADRVVVLAAGVVLADTRQRPQRLAVAAAYAPRPVGPGHRNRTVADPRAREARRLLATGGAAKWLAGGALLSGAAGLAGLALTATSVWLICRAAQHPNVQALEIAVVGVRTFALARALLRYGERLISHDGALRLLAEVRARVFAALAPLVPGGVDVRRGDLLRRFVSDVDGVQEGLVRAVVPLAGAVLTATGAVALAALLAPAAGIALALAMLVGIVAAPVLSRVVAGRGEQLSALAGHRDARTIALLDGLPELTAYGADERAASAIGGMDDTFGAASRRSAAAGALGVAVSGTAAAAALPGVLALGAAAADSGSLAPIQVGVLAACVLAGFDALAPLPSAFAAWARFRAGLARVLELLLLPAPVPEPSSPRAMPIAASALRAVGLSVRPATDAAIAVTDVDLLLRRGERVAVLGPSGCGKSTLLSAALRLLPAETGSIGVEDGTHRIALAEVTSADVASVISGSLQGDHVFDASLRDNLCVVKPHATNAEVEAAVRGAGLTEFVAGLTDGWATPAGPDGAALSGGQRQRLLLARALLADPGILVLDEPTAHLDPDTEREILHDLLAGTTGRTVLMSTHRRVPDGAFDDVVELGADGRRAVGGEARLPSTSQSSVVGVLAG